MDFTDFIVLIHFVNGSLSYKIAFEIKSSTEYHIFTFVALWPV